MTLSESSFKLVVKNHVRFGVGIVNELPTLLREYGFQKVGFVVDKNLYESCVSVRMLIDRIKQERAETIVCFYDQKFEPSYDFVDGAKMKFKKRQQALIDCIVGIGGGSAMDTAKVMAILCTNHEPALTYRGFPKNLKKPLPVIAIPSTAGTGSEVVYNAPLIDTATNVKRGINDLNNYPILALLDPKLVSTAPASVAIASGCDALVHTLESFVSIKANEMTRMLSKQAFSLIINTLPMLIKDKDNLEYWARMQWGAYCATIALSNASPGPAGALSDHLGCQFRVPHGIAGAVFIGKITRLNHELGYHGYSDLYPYLEPHDPLIKEKEKRSEIVVEAIENFLDTLAIPKDLNGFGVTEEDYLGFFTFATEKAKTVFDFNPVKYSKDVISQLLRQMIVVQKHKGKNQLYAYERSSA